MNNNINPIDSDYYQSLIYMHDITFDMTYKSPVFKNNSLGIECTVYDKKYSKEAFRAIYIPIVGIMSISSHVDNVTCTFALPAEHLKHNIDSMSVSSLLQYLIELDFLINDDMSILYRDDLDYYFNIDNLSQNPKLFKVFLNIKSATNKLKDYYK